MTTEQLRPLLTTIANHPKLKGHDIRVFILAERLLSPYEARELKLDAIIPVRPGVNRSRATAWHSLARLVSAGFVIEVDRRGSRGRKRYRLPVPPQGLQTPELPIGNQK